MKAFSILLLALQLAISLILVGWVLSNAGLLNEAVVVVLAGLTGIVALAVGARAWLGPRRQARPSPAEENL